MITLSELIKIRFQLVRTKIANNKRVITTMQGNYPSFFHGRGMDFLELRQYSPGDDIRAIDWRVTARTGQTHIKLFREERERPVFIVVDYSPSMFFGTQRRFKSVVAAHVAAWLAWVAQTHGDRVGGFVFSSKKNYKKLRPTNGQLGVSHLLKALVELQPKSCGNSQSGKLGWALSQLQQVVPPGSLICLLSDFYSLDSHGEVYFKLLAQSNDVLAVCIYDPLEQALPSQAGNYEITDGEEMLSLDVDSSIRQAYQQGFEQRQADLEKFCKQRGAYWLALATPDNISEKLLWKLGMS